MKKEPGISFILLALLALIGGVFLGSISAFQFIFPGFLDALPFFKSRPLHVSLVVSWIFLASVGGIYYYLPRHCGLRLFSPKLARFQFWLFFLTGVIILSCYTAGKFGGREYWEFPAVLAIPVIISWALFGVNYFKTVFRKAGQWPVYLWMWGTGIFFFLFTFAESYLWIFPYFRDNLVRDLTVQWKAYGALVGSWNMLVYGTAIFVMEKIKGDESIAHSKLSFLMYFLSLANLLFGWAHHIYIVPAAAWIRYTAYIISMTELIILAKIIRDFKSSLSEAKRNFHFIPVKFLAASDAWILLNLLLALAISVPAVNIFTHGTHITVAHAMGSTIGINTMILLASCFFILHDRLGTEWSNGTKKIVTPGFWILNLSLLVFWLALVMAGAEKGKMLAQQQLSFQEIMQNISPWLNLFAFAGLGILAGLLMVCVPVLLNSRKIYFKSPLDYEPDHNLKN